MLTRPTIAQYQWRCVADVELSDASFATMAIAKLGGWNSMTRLQAFCLFGAIALTGCDRFESQPINATNVEGKVRSSRNGGEEVRVWRDPETGCQYLLWERRQRGAMTPRLGSDGKPICK